MIHAQITWPQALYIATEIRRKRSSSDPDALTQTLQDAKVDLNPHQVESALFAFRSPLSSGALLADEVGLGKTIEAGIILSQKWAERKRRLLIIAPANLRKQWVEELEDKFYLPAFILDKKGVKAQKERGRSNPFESERIIVCSYDFARRNESYLRQAMFDLVVLDEAHRLRNVYRKDNRTGNTLRVALEGKKKVLLTATPLQNSLYELYGLTSFIDPYVFGDFKSFKARYSGTLTEADFAQLKKRLAPLCQRTLRRQVLEYVSYTARIPMLQEFVPSEEETKLYNMVTKYLQRPQLYSIQASQRTLTTLVLRKLLASSSYAIGGTLDTLLGRIDNRLSSAEEELAETASDYEGIQLLLEEYPEESEDLSSETQEMSEEDIALLREEREWLAQCQALAHNIEHNSKAEQLLVALKQGFEQLSQLGAERKALIFTESRRTQEYLFRLLSEHGYADQVMTFSGTNTDARSAKILKDWKAIHAETDRVTGVKEADMRAALVDHFRHKATIMIATEAAAEGINLQFCSLVVNYDLPWNPQRIEQRIGRCHRYGQRHDVVVINFLDKTNAADRRVYELLDEKFRLFNGVFGASDEVLGSISSGTDFEQRIAQIYQNCRTEEEIQKAFDTLKSELSPQIDERMRQTRATLLEHFDDEVRRRLRDSEERSRRLLARYEELLWLLTQFILRDKADFSLQDYSFTLREPISEVAHAGHYYMLERKGREVIEGDTGSEPQGSLYRANHPLAQYVMQQAQLLDTSLQECWVIDYSHSGRNISPVAELVGQQGYISVDLLSIHTADSQERLITAMVTSDGRVIEDKILSHLWTLPSSMELYESLSRTHLPSLIEEIKDQQVDTTSQKAKEDAFTLFKEEMDKIDMWAEDMKAGLEQERKDLEQTIRLRKVEMRKADTIAERLLMEREVQQLEKELRRKRSEQFEADDRIEAQKDQLMSDLEKLIELRTERTTLFILPWKIR